MLMMATFSDLAKKCQKQIKQLDWQLYHTPENVLAFLMSEVGELSELCVWLTREQIVNTPQIKENVEKELADVVKAALYLYNSLKLDLTLETLIDAKLSLENIKYPVATYTEKSKYQALTVAQVKRAPIKNLPGKNITKEYTIKDFQKRAWDQSVERKWDAFYTPATLCLAVFEDCSKIHTAFQRRVANNKVSYPKMIWAISGVLILCLRLHTFLGLTISLESLVSEKIKEDTLRFRVS